MLGCILHGAGFRGGGQGGQRPPPPNFSPPGQLPGGGKEFLGSLPLSQRKLTVLISNAIMKPKNLNLNNRYFIIKCHFEVNIDYRL